ncbi:MAG: metallopeptidase TldD-related protein [Xanthomonadales bacterium]|nr:metallopeptidase TldD-related protein [Xanthomonadales bacterium]
MPRLLMLLALIATPLPGYTEDEVAFRAMADEMERNFEQLRLGEEPAPYFIEYRMEDSYRLRVKAVLGAATSDSVSRSRRGSAQVRVGSHELDSSLVQRFNQRGSTMHRYYDPRGFTLPVDQDYAGIRRAFWVATDLAYKRALEDFAVKQADADRVLDRDGMPDFWKVEPAEMMEDISAEPVDEAAVRSLVGELSRVFEGIPEIHESAAWGSVGFRVVRQLNSEGTRVRRTVSEVTLGMIVRTQADDGAVLWDFELYKVPGWSQLPSATELKRAAHALARRLIDARKAQRLDQYIGPVLFQGQAAAVLFANQFATQLMSVPRMVAAEPAVRRWVTDLQEREQRFGRKIGARVLPRGSTLVDDPTLKEFAGLPLGGSFSVDDEGVPGRPKVLVEDGRLQQILSTRVPMYGTTGSTGNNRGGFPMPSNLILTSQQPANPKELRAKFEELRVDAATDFVIEIEKMAVNEVRQALESMQSMPAFSYGDRLPQALVAWKVYPDGSRVRIRNLNIEPFAVREFRRLEAVGDDPYVHTTTPPFPSGGTFLSGVRGRMEPASFVVPSLLFEELAVGDSKAMDRRPPVLSRP